LPPSAQIWQFWMALVVPQGKVEVSNVKSVFMKRRASACAPVHVLIVAVLLSGLAGGTLTRRRHMRPRTLRIALDCPLRAPFNKSVLNDQIMTFSRPSDAYPGIHQENMTFIRR
jgi:hypothetical protein